MARKSNTIAPKTDLASLAAAVAPVDAQEPVAPVPAVEVAAAPEEPVAAAKAQAKKARTGRKVAVPAAAPAEPEPPAEPPATDYSFIQVGAAVYTKGGSVVRVLSIAEPEVTVERVKDGGKATVRFDYLSATKPSAKSAEQQDEPEPEPESDGQPPKVYPSRFGEATEEPTPTPAPAKKKRSRTTGAVSALPPAESEDATPANEPVAAECETRVEGPATTTQYKSTQEMRLVFGFRADDVGLANYLVTTIAKRHGIAKADAERSILAGELSVSLKGARAGLPQGDYLRLAQQERAAGADKAAKSPKPATTPKAPKTPAAPKEPKSTTQPAAKDVWLVMTKADVHASTLISAIEARHGEVLSLGGSRSHGYTATFLWQQRNGRAEGLLDAPSLHERLLAVEQLT
jgi:NACalpha-BTF3-like transcription factor